MTPASFTSRRSLIPTTERLVESVETEKPARRRETEDHRHEGITSGVEGFNDRARGAIADEQLHDSIELFTHKSVAGRNAVLNALPEAPELRELAYRIKQETMAHLDRYLEQMADAVEARGGNVFFAGDGEDVVRYIGDLARNRGAKVITKSKSMATEEIELNRRLEEDYADLGLEIVETDLGEWIAQLAGDTPSHIVGPILHMNRKRITEVLSRTAGEELPPDVEALGSFARRRLREKFLTADIGITGANFGVAETGTVVTVTNEGNARLVTSVPPVHVVVMGIEKLVPRFADLSVFIKLLARSSTGQELTVYTNFITGPRATGELDGAEELHLILMDNGRSKLLGTEFEEALSSESAREPSRGSRRCRPGGTCRRST
jgi:L-lactate dehydrogenase complex protein LldF